MGEATEPVSVDRVSAGMVVATAVRTPLFPFFYPDNGTGAVARARLARNRPNKPGWMAWSKRRSSIPRSSRSGWTSSAITRSKARDGSSSVWRGASTPASPGSSSSIQAGNHSGVISGSKSCSKATRHAVPSAQSGKSAASITRSNTSGARWQERTTTRWRSHGRAASNGLRQCDGAAGGQAILTLRTLVQSSRFDQAWALLSDTYRQEVIVPNNVVAFPRTRAA